MAPSNARKNRRSSRAAAPSAHNQKQRSAAAPPAAPIAALSISALTTQARAHESRGEFFEAAQLLERAAAAVATATATATATAALPDAADGAAVEEEAARLYMQAGRADEAEAALRRAVALCPEAGFEKFGYLAQLLGNSEEALWLARKGIEVIRAEAVRVSEGKGEGEGEGGDGGRGGEEERLAELRGLEASAHCAVAEICLGIIEDSNDVEVARAMDGEVEAAVAAALGLSEEGSEAEVEAMVALANLRLSQGRKEEAVESMKRVVRRMAEGLRLLEEEGESDEVVGKALGELPNMEVRIAVGKQLVEVEMWRAAVSVLGSVMWECDYNVEVWYLVAVAYWKMGDVAEAKGVLEGTRAVLRRAGGFEGELDEAMIDKLYSELDNNGATAAVNKGGESGGGGDGGGGGGGRGDGGDGGDGGTVQEAMRD